MNSNELEAIRSGLMQYVGAFLEHTDREGKEAAHVALAQLSEVWLQVCLDKGKGHYDMFVAKPLLKACSVLLHDYQNVLAHEATEIGPGAMDAVYPALRNMEKAENTLKELVENIKGAKEE